MINLKFESIHKMKFEKVNFWTIFIEKLFAYRRMRKNERKGRVSWEKWNNSGRIFELKNTLLPSFLSPDERNAF